MCLLLFSGLLWHLAVVPAVVARCGGLCSRLYQGQFRSLILCMALVYPCSYSGAGDYKATGLTGLALSWHAAEPLCCTTYTHTHLHSAASGAA